MTSGHYEAIATYYPRLFTAGVCWALDLFLRSVSRLWHSAPSSPFTRPGSPEDEQQHRFPASTPGTRFLGARRGFDSPLPTGTGLFAPPTVTTALRTREAPQRPALPVAPPPLGPQMAPDLGCWHGPRARIRPHTPAAADGARRGLPVLPPAASPTAARAAAAARRRGGGGGARSSVRQQRAEVGAPSQPRRAKFAELREALLGFGSAFFALGWRLCPARGNAFCLRSRRCSSGLGGWVGLSGAAISAARSCRETRGERSPDPGLLKLPRSRKWPPQRPAPLLCLQMSGMLVIAAWCFLQVESRHPEIVTGSSNHGNFLDNDKWLSTVSQYDKDKYWNKFRDVSTALFGAYFVFASFVRLRCVAAGF